MKSEVRMSKSSPRRRRRFRHLDFVILSDLRSGFRESPLGHATVHWDHEPQDRSADLRSGAKASGTGVSPVCWSACSHGRDARATIGRFMESGQMRAHFGVAGCSLGIFSFCPIFNLLRFTPGFASAISLALISKSLAIFPAESPLDTVTMIGGSGCEAAGAAGAGGAGQD